jgi:hypothetical protein
MLLGAEQPLLAWVMAVLDALVCRGASGIAIKAILEGTWPPQNQSCGRMTQVVAPARLPAFPLRVQHAKTGETLRAAIA